MREIVLFIILVSINLTLLSQEKYLTNVAETQKLSKKVVSLFNKNKIKESFDELRPYWPLSENEIGTIEDQTITYKKLIDERFGKSIEVLKFKDETISDFAIRETQLIRFNHSAIRLLFTYYKSEGGWILNAFKWDDSYENEFKQE